MSKQPLEWIELKSEDQLDQIRKESSIKPVLIFKHSSRCAISRVTLERLERNWKAEEMSHVKPYLLDLISFRETSARIASRFEVPHESPQVLLIENGQSIYDQAHFAIDYKQILEATKS